MWNVWDFLRGVFLCILFKYLWYLLSRCSINHPFHLASLDDLQGLQPRHVKSLGAQVMHRPRYYPPLYYTYYIVMTLPFNAHLLDIPDVFQLQVYNVMCLHVLMQIITHYICIYTVSAWIFTFRCLVYCFMPHSGIFHLCGVFLLRSGLEYVPRILCFSYKQQLNGVIYTLIMNWIRLIVQSP